MAYSIKDPQMVGSKQGTTDFRRNAIKKRLQTTAQSTDEQTNMTNKRKQVGY